MILLEKLILTIILPIILLVGCYNVPKYSGDGHLVDNGGSVATDRYVLNLGLIDLRQRGSSTHRIKNLPEAHFVVGIELRVLQKDISTLEKKTVNPTILLELSGLKGEVIFSKKSKLNSWTWSALVDESQAFIYGRRGQTTYFQSLPQSDYTLTLTVLQPDFSQLKYTALLILKSAGWK